MNLEHFVEQTATNFPKLSKMDRFRISNYLYQAYEFGLNQGWAFEQDKSRQAYLDGIRDSELEHDRYSL